MLIYTIALRHKPLLSRSFPISSSGSSAASCSRGALRSGSGLLLYALGGYANRAIYNQSGSYRIRRLDGLSWTGPRELAPIDPAEGLDQAWALVPGRQDGTC